MIAVPFEIAGPTGGHKSTQFSSELTQNIYLDYSEAADKRGAHDFPGLKSLGIQSGVDRGWHVMAGTLYKICGATLYRITASGVYTSLGPVSGSGRAVFADDGRNLLFAVGGVLYKYDGTLSAISQSVVTNPASVAYINRQFIITGAGGLFATSNVGDPDAWNALNFAEEETAPDALLRAYVFNQLAYMVGAETIVPWYNSGIGNPPFDRQDTALVNVGAAGTHAICNTDQYLYWLGDDRKVYRAVGASFQSISTAAIGRQIDGIEDVSDCVFSAFTFDSQDFILVSFPSGGKSFIYSETYGYWVVLASGTDYPTTRWLGNAVINVYGKNLAADYRSGNIYELDKDTYTDAGGYRLRVRILPSFTGALMGRPGRRITVCKIRLNIQKGVGLASGQGVNPVLMCQLSNDGGHTWGAESHVEMGEMGDYVTPVDFDAFANGYDIRCRIKCSDPVFLSMFDGVVLIRDGGS